MVFCALQLVSMTGLYCTGTQFPVGNFIVGSSIFVHKSDYSDFQTWRLISKLNEKEKKNGKSTKVEGECRTKDLFISLH